MPEILEESPLADLEPRRRLVYDEDERVGRWIAERVDGEWRIGAKCIGLESQGELIGGCMYDSWNGASICIHVAGEGRRWLDRNFLFHAFYYPFVHLGAKVLIGTVPEGNLDARRFDENLGFQLHTKIPDGHPTGALFVYLMRREDCRWLKMKGELH